MKRRLIKKIPRPREKAVKKEKNIESLNQLATTSVENSTLKIYSLSFSPTHSTDDLLGANLSKSIFTRIESHRKQAMKYILICTVQQNKIQEISTQIPPIYRNLYINCNHDMHGYIISQSASHLWEDITFASMTDSVWIPIWVILH